jgi:hypothetical protein
VQACWYYEPHHFQRPYCDWDSDQSSQSGEEKSLTPDLLEQLECRGADRAANGELTSTRTDAREQKGCCVQARDE